MDSQQHAHAYWLRCPPPLHDLFQRAAHAAVRMPPLCLGVHEPHTPVLSSLAWPPGRRRDSRRLYLSALRVNLLCLMSISERLRARKDAVDELDPGCARACSSGFCHLHPFPCPNCPRLLACLLSTATVGNGTWRLIRHPKPVEGATVTSHDQHGCAGLHARHACRLASGGHAKRRTYNVLCSEDTSALPSPGSSSAPERAARPDAAQARRWSAEEAAKGPNVARRRWPTTTTTVGDDAESSAVMGPLLLLLLPLGSGGRSCRVAGLAAERAAEPPPGTWQRAGAGLAQTPAACVASGGRVARGATRWAGRPSHRPWCAAGTTATWPPAAAPPRLAVRCGAARCGRSPPTGLGMEGGGGRHGRWLDGGAAGGAPPPLERRM